MISIYINYVEQYYKEHGITTVVQVESVLLIYKLTGSEKAFGVLYKTHEQLLLKLLRNNFNNYKNKLYKEDYNELLLMLNEEFYRRVLFCKLPTAAPFSAYIQLYLKKWLNAYTKQIVKCNDRVVFNCDKFLIGDSSEY